MSCTNCNKCSKCTPHKTGQTVLVNGGQHMGRIVKVHKTSTGEHRYQVRWQHPSESGAQKGWFNHGEIY